MRYLEQWRKVAEGGDFDSVQSPYCEVTKVVERSRNHRPKKLPTKKKSPTNEATTSKKNMKGYMYILECSDKTYYTGSTINLEKRLEEHNAGEGANYTARRLPVKLLYFEEFEHVALAFYREKQIQGWSRAKKEALIKSKTETLPFLSECKNETHFKNKKKK